MKPVRWATWNRDSERISSPVLQVCQSMRTVEYLGRAADVLDDISVNLCVTLNYSGWQLRTRRAVALFCVQLLQTLTDMI